MLNVGGKHHLNDWDDTTDRLPRLPALRSLVRVQIMKRDRRKVERCHYCVMQILHPKNEDCCGTGIATNWR